MFCKDRWVAEQRTLAVHQPFFNSCGSGRGEMIVSDSHRRDIQVFGPDGELLQNIGPKGNSKVVWDTLQRFQGIVSDDEGRLYFAKMSSVVALF